MVTCRAPSPATGRSVSVDGCPHPRPPLPTVGERSFLPLSLARERGAGGEGVLLTVFAGPVLAEAGVVRVWLAVWGRCDRPDRVGAAPRVRVGLGVAPVLLRLRH